MKFSTREDIDAPIDQVFLALTDFEAFERSAMRRGADVRRTDRMAAPGVGMTWDVAFRMRGRQRELALEMARFVMPNEMVIQATSPGLNGVFSIELMALSRNRTRMSVGLELSPLNLSARLLVQSLKLAKSSLTKRFKLRVAEYVKVMEDRLGSAA